MKANVYIATVNVPGYLPMDDEPAVFRVPGDGWAYLADEREWGLDGVATFDVAGDATWVKLSHLGDTNGNIGFAALRASGALAIIADGRLGTVHGPTPGSDSDHDLGLAYTVSLVKHSNYPHSPGYLHGCPACDLACHCMEGVTEGYEAPCVFEGEHDYDEPEDGNGP